MNKTFALEHSTAEASAPHEPHTLGVLAAALVTCTHPEASHVRAAAEPYAAQSVWCAACGALRSGEGSTVRWQPATLPSLLTKKPFEEVVLLLHAIHQLTLLARSQPSPAPPGSPAHVLLRNLRSSLGELSRMPLVRDVDRLEAAIAEMPPSLLRP
jgi:hypothetical protein